MDSMVTTENITKQGLIIKYKKSGESSISQIGVPNPQFGLKTYYLTRFLTKTRGSGRGVARASPLDLPMKKYIGQ